MGNVISTNNGKSNNMNAIANHNVIIAEVLPSTNSRVILPMTILITVVVVMIMLKLILTLPIMLAMLLLVIIIVIMPTWD